MLLTKLLWFAFGRQALIRATQGLAINHSWSILIVAPPQWWFFNSVQHILHACMHIPNMYCPLLSCTHIHPPIESIVLSCMEIHILYMHKDRLTCMYTKIPFRSIAFPVLAMQSWKSCWRQWLPTLLAASSCELSEKTLCFYKMPGKSSKGTFKGVIIVTYLNLIFELVRDMRLTCQHVLGQAFRPAKRHYGPTAREVSKFARMFGCSRSLWIQFMTYSVPPPTGTTRCRRTYWENGWNEPEIAMPLQDSVICIAQTIESLVCHEPKPVQCSKNVWKLETRF